VARLTDPLIAIVLIISLSGCSTTWETATPPEAKSYTVIQDQLSRSVGKLRRLLILPPVVRTQDCPSNPSDNELSEILYKGIERYLYDWKGYEVLCQSTKNEEDSKQLVMRLGDWQEGDIGDGFPSQTDRINLIKLANEAQVDGIVITHGYIYCLNAIDITLYFMIIGMPNWSKKLFGENLSTGIYDANSGRLTWKHHINVLHPSVGGGVDPSLWASGLFSNIENAVPAVLSK
jgi:hypothetical protein